MVTSFTEKETNSEKLSYLDQLAFIKMVLRCKSCSAPNKIYAFNFLDTMLSPCNGEVDDGNYYTQWEKWGIEKAKCSRKGN